MNREYLRTGKGRGHLLRLLLLLISIIYMNILSCGQNAFGGHANVNSTSDSEFIHIIVWVALAVDGFVFACRLFERDDGTSDTSLLIGSAFSLLYFVAFVILLVSWIKCSDGATLFCQGRHRCLVHLLPTLSIFSLSVLSVYDDVYRSLRFHSNSLYF